MITDQCPCHYPDNYASNKRWCCGDIYHLDLSVWAYERVCSYSSSQVPTCMPATWRPRQLSRVGIETYICVLRRRLGGDTQHTRPALCLLPPIVPPCALHLQLADKKWGVIGVAWRDVPCWYKPKKQARIPAGSKPSRRPSWERPPSGWQPSMDRRIGNRFQWQNGESHSGRKH
jgi:hypothetical protein